MLYKLSDFDVETLSVSNSKNATYLQSNKQSFELQTDWVTLGKYPLPGKKFISDDAKSINLTLPVSENDIDFKVWSDTNNKLSNFNILPNKKLSFVNM